MPDEFEFTEHGAATVVSAIGSYFGVALGVSLKTTARLRRVGGRGTEISVSGPEQVDDRLVRECINYARRRGLLSGPLDVEVKSEIPPSRGMKSSSSVSLALMGAALRVSGRRFTDSMLLRMSAEASIRAGVSVTGAYDDAAACHYGGIVFASNRGMRVLRRMSIRHGYSVVFCIPERRITKGSLPVGEISKHAPEMKSIYRTALKGRFREASMANTMLLCSLLDIDPAPATAAYGAGAAVAGLTGTGPAFFALTRSADTERIASLLARYGRAVITEPTGVSSSGFAF